MDVSTCNLPRHPVRHHLLAVGALFVALGALVGSIGLIGGWLSFGDRLNQRLPFASPVLAGVALFVAIAVPFAALAARAWRGDDSTGPTSIVVGAVLVLWIVVQLAFLREFSAFQPIYAAIGVAFVVAGRRVRAAPRTRCRRGARRAVPRPAERIVMIGATDDPKKFGATMFRALVDHGHDVVPVNPHRSTIDGITCLPDLRAVPGEVDAVMVMLTGPAALDAVRECVLRDVSMVWLFRGVGSPGRVVSRGRLRCVATDGVAVIAGACPLMFLAPVSGAHQAHLRVRRFAHAVA